MKLHAEQRILAMAYAHDFARVTGVLAARRLTPGTLNQLFGQRAGPNHQAVIARSGKRIVEAGEHACLIMDNLVRLAMHQAIGADDVAAKRLANGLMPQANTQQWQLTGETLDTSQRDAGFARC